MITKTALFIGRFQPFHLGHLSVLKEIDNTPDIGRILIGIGSSQESQTIDNPFNYRQREAMITAALAGQLAKPFKIFGIQDMFHPELWYQMVLLTSREKFAVVYSGNDWTRGIFARRGLTVRPTTETSPIHGCHIRDLINHHRNFHHLVPLAVYHQIKNLKKEFVWPKKP